jgi:tetratricopeptide (TPR) repeat protein
LKPHKRALSLFEEALMLIDEGEFEEALPTLEECMKRQPKNLEVLDTLLYVYYQLQLAHRAWKLIEKLVELRGNEKDCYNFAATSLKVGAIFTAVRAVETYLQKYPHGEYLPKLLEVKTTVDQYYQESATPEELEFAKLNITGIYLFERARILIEGAYTVEGLQAAQQAQKHLPDYLPIQNLMALGQSLLGNFEAAITTCEAVLAQDPTNIFARANLLQCQIRLGQLAAPHLAQLLQITPTSAEDWLKQLETVAMAGDDQAVYDHYRRYQTTFSEQLGAYVYHAAATACARLGNEAEARKLWHTALEQNPEFPYALNNLEDLKQPVGLRNGAWYFAVEHWLLEPWRQVINQKMTQRGVDLFVEQTPAIRVAFEKMLLQGDVFGREAALEFAAQYQLPILKEFALGKLGTDGQRLRAMHLARQIGLLPAQTPLTIYLKGTPQEVLPLPFEVHEESNADDLPVRLQQQTETIHAMLHSGRLAAALPVIETALRDFPDYPTLLNYQTLVFEGLERWQEWEALVQKTAALHPDYLFGQTSLAQFHLRHRNYAAAHAVLKPLQARPRLHISEFRVLAKMHFDLALAEKHTEIAQQWFSWVESVSPYDAIIPYMQKKLNPNGLIGRLANLFRRRT